MENCKADKIAERLFRSYWKQGKLSLCKKHLYRGLYIKSCSVDVSAIKRIQANICNIKHLQIYSKIHTAGAVQVFSLEIHPQFHLLGFFLLGTYFQEHLRVLLILFFFFLAAMCHTLFVSVFLFLQKIRRSVLFSTS